MKCSPPPKRTKWLNRSGATRARQTEREVRRATKAEVLREIAAATGMVIAEALPKPSARVEDLFILDWVHYEPCCASGLPGHRCRGRIEADHAGPHPYGRKSHDTEVIALASDCHANRTNPRSGASGPFDRMTPAERLEWRAAQIAAHQTRFYGRPLVEDDLATVRAAVEAGRNTRGLLLPTAAERRPEAY